jgi:hypothetical protein
MNLKFPFIGLLFIVIPFFSNAQQSVNPNAFPVQITTTNGIIEGELQRIFKVSKEFLLHNHLLVIYVGKRLNLLRIGPV